jgi:hypothetical protein
MPSPETREFSGEARQAPSPAVKEFINKVVKRVHFFPDRHDIELELAAHIEDSILFLQEEGGLSNHTCLKKKRGSMR